MANRCSQRFVDTLEKQRKGGPRPETTLRFPKTNELRRDGAGDGSYVALKVKLTSFESLSATVTFCVCVPYFSCQASIT